MKIRFHPDGKGLTILNWVASLNRSRPPSGPPAVAKPTPPPRTLGGWRGLHRDHGRCGPYPDARVADWDVHRCPCGSRFYAAAEDKHLGDGARGEPRPLDDAKH